jgi:transcription elongation factor Elf1
MAAIECPGCNAQMKVPKLGKMQTVTCDSCGLSGEIEV